MGVVRAPLEDGGAWNGNCAPDAGSDFVRRVGWPGFGL